MVSILLQALGLDVPVWSYYLSPDLLHLSQLLLINFCLLSASSGHIVIVQYIQSSAFLSIVGAFFPVSSRFVLNCHLVTVHYFPYSDCVTIVFTFSALVDHKVHVLAQRALNYSQNLAWSSCHLFQLPL